MEVHLIIFLIFIVTMFCVGIKKQYFDEPIDYSVYDMWTKGKPSWNEGNARHSAIFKEKLEKELKESRKRRNAIKENLDYLKTNNPQSYDKIYEEIKICRKKDIQDMFDVHFYRRYRVDKRKVKSDYYRQIVSSDFDWLEEEIEKAMKNSTS